MPKPEPKIDMTKHLNKKRILIVEDDPEVMKTFDALLTRNGYETSMANYALPALFRATENPPDLILADLQMPMMTGLEMISQFKGHADTHDIPVVVVTGCSSEESRAAAFKAGCDGFVTKPIDPVEFLAQVKHFCKKPQKRP